MSLPVLLKKQVTFLAYHIHSEAHRGKASPPEGTGWPTPQVRGDLHILELRVLNLQLMCADCIWLGAEEMLYSPNKVISWRKFLESWVKGIVPVLLSLQERSFPVWNVDMEINYMFCVWTVKNEKNDSVFGCAIIGSSGKASSVWATFQSRLYDMYRT